MSGDAAPDYHAARRVLLDALEALGPHREAIVLVGAQAIYIHVGDAGFSVAEYTTDGDLALDLDRLEAAPDVARLLEEAGLTRKLTPEGEAMVGIWGRWEALPDGPAVVSVDLLVAEQQSPTGRRAGRLPGEHSKHSAIKVRGIEAALVDNEQCTVRALEPGDSRAYEIAVAGPAALLVSKVLKIVDRVEGSEEDNPRLKDKDALDVLRLLRGCDLGLLAGRLRGFEESTIARLVTPPAIAELVRLFSEPHAPGCEMLARSLLPEERATAVASCTVLVGELMNKYRASGAVA